MQRPNRMKIIFSLLSLSLLLSDVALGSVNPSAGGTFRTPARRFGALYSVKLTLWRDGFSTVIPVWIRPDLPESSLDPGQLRFYGWPHGDLKTDETELSGVGIPFRRFKSERADLAIMPEFAKNCCLGTLGRDVLSGYRLRFVPGPPAHIEWTPVTGAPSAKTGWTGLKGMFSIRDPLIRWKNERWDLSRSPWSVDFGARSLRFEGEPFEDEPGGATPLLGFDFVPGSRKLRIVSFNPPARNTARTLGIRPGMVVTELNGEPVAELDRYQIEQLLKGKSGRKIEISFLRDPLKEDKSKVVFDFSKHEFIQTESVQTPAGRNQNP
jgi:hypothetical protein